MPKEIKALIVMKKTEFFETLGPSPVFNKENFPLDFQDKLPVDNKKLYRGLEFIALKNSPVKVIKKSQIFENVVQVYLPSYSSQSTFMDIRSLQKVEMPRCRNDRKIEANFETAFFEQTEDADLRLNKSEILSLSSLSSSFLTSQSRSWTDSSLFFPFGRYSVSELLGKLFQFIGSTYVWGGNYRKGIKEWADWYPVPETASDLERVFWEHKGVDCSGLLYEVTDGYTPRNTSELMDFGIEVDLDNIKPLDIVVWKGHVIIAIDETYCIESKHEMGGVCIRKLTDSIESKDFVVRRFHEETLS